MSEKKIVVRVPHPDNWPDGVVAMMTPLGPITRELALRTYVEFTPTPRERLVSIVEEIAAAAIERINDPKNIAKGDDWREWTSLKLQALCDGEMVEFEQEVFEGFEAYRRGDGFALMEAGDVVAVLAMMLDKFRAEEEK